MKIKKIKKVLTQLQNWAKEPEKNMKPTNSNLSELFKIYERIKKLIFKKMKKSELKIEKSDKNTSKKMYSISL